MKKIILYTLCLFTISCIRREQNIVIFDKDLDTVFSISEKRRLPVCVILYDSTKNNISDFLSNMEKMMIHSVPAVINAVNICTPKNEWYAKILDPDIYPLTCVFDKGVLLDLLPGTSVESFRYIDNVITTKKMSEFHYNQIYDENKRLFISFANSAIKIKMMFDEKKLISKDIDSLMSYYEHPYMYYLKMISASSFGHTGEAKDAAKKLVTFGLSNNVVKYYNEIISANQFLDSTYIYGTAPSIETTQRVVSISECHVDNTYHLSFPIKNKGKKDLVISEILTSCSCVSINNSDPITIKGGDYKTLEVDFKPDIIGTLKREIYIVSNSIETPVYIITINAQVE